MGIRRKSASPLRGQASFSASMGKSASPRIAEAKALISSASRGDSRKNFQLIDMAVDAERSAVLRL